MRERRSRIARFIIGRRFAPTRWLHPGYKHAEWLQSFLDWTQPID
jgi:hypothetical protein